MSVKEAADSRPKKRGSVLRFITAIFLTVIVITGIACSVVGYLDVIHDIHDTSSQTAHSVSVILEDMYNSDVVSGNEGLLQADFRRDERMERVSKMLQLLCKDLDLVYLYVFTIDEEEKEYLYYFTAAADEEINEKVSQERGFGTVVPTDSFPQSVLAASKGATNTEVWKNENKYGKVYSWMYPLFDKEGNVRYIVGVDFDATKIENEIFQHTLRTSASIVLILLIMFLLLLILIRRKVLVPIKFVSTKMNRFMDDKERDDTPLDISVNNEVGEIADSFNKMRNDINQYLTEISTLTTERVQTQTQMEIAQRIQYGIVPAETYLNTKSYDAYAVERPCRNVGGDFYDLFVRDGDTLCAAVGDVSGKGVTAALFMVMVRTAIREKLLSGLSPARVLNLINDEICASNPEGLFATVFIAVLHLATGRLEYANAGHTPPVLLGQSETFLKVDSGIPVGLFEDAGIENAERLLAPGEGFLLYTDGVTEAVSKGGQFFGHERVLSATKGKKDARETVISLKADVRTFAEGREQFDDLTILAFFYGTYEPELSLAPQRSEWEKLKAFVLDKTDSSPLQKKLMLICDEIFTNIVSYSGAKKIGFSCEKEARCFTLLFTDDGKPFDPLSEKQNKKDFEEYDMGGMGILLVRQTADSIYYQRHDGQNRLLCRVDISADNKKITI